MSSYIYISLDISKQAVLLYKENMRFIKIKL